METLQTDSVNSDCLTEQVELLKSVSITPRESVIEATDVDEWIRQREAKAEAKRQQAKADKERLRKQLAEERDAAALRAAALEPKRPIPPGFIPLRHVDCFLGCDRAFKYHSSTILNYLILDACLPLH
jgi:hypothetical protein